MRYVFRVLAISLLTSVVVGLASGSATKFHWRKAPITISVSSSLTLNQSNIAVNADTLGALDRAIATWQQAAAVLIRHVPSNETSVSPSQLGDGISLVTIAATPENVALFPKGLEDSTARTRIFYDSRGLITEADIVLNPYLQFSTDGTPGTFDLESTLTHEVGHLLGLAHSPVLAATMNDDYARNGVYNLPAYSARTLGSDDIAAIRSLYGPTEKTEECCGKVLGKLTFSSGKPAANATVWATNVDDGRVIAATTTAPDGSFKFGGLPLGKIDVFVQGSDSETGMSAVELGEYLVSTRSSATVTRMVASDEADLRLDYIGFNGQLAGIAVPVNAGNTYFLLAGLTDFKGWDAYLETSSSKLIISSRTFPSVYASGIGAVGFDLSVSPDTNLGEYSILLRSRTGAKRYLIGAVTVEKFPNLWSSQLYK
jgi:hypothetical protein